MNFQELVIGNTRLAYFQPAWLPNEQPKVEPTDESTVGSSSNLFSKVHAREMLDRESHLCNRSGVLIESRVQARRLQVMNRAGGFPAEKHVNRVFSNRDSGNKKTLNVGEV